MNHQLQTLLVQAGVETAEHLIQMAGLEQQTQVAVVEVAVIVQHELAATAAPVSSS